MLVRADEEPRRIVLPPPSGLVQGFLHGVPEHRFPATGRDVHDSRGRDELLVHHVAQPPPAPRPGIGEVGLRLVVGQRVERVAVLAPELVGMNVQGTGKFRPGRLGKQAGDVVVVAEPVKPHVIPGREHGPADDALMARFLQLVDHVGPVPVDLAPYERVGVGVDGFAVGTDEQPGLVLAHLVVVLEDVGMPVLEHDPGHVPGFHQVEHEGVPVVVVSAVLVIQPWEIASLVVRAQVLLVPVGHHDLAVRVETRDHQEDDVFQYVLRGVVFARHQVVGELGRHLRRGDLTGVEAHGLADDDLAFLHQAVDLAFGKAPRIGDPPVDFPQFLKVREVVRGGDDGQQEGVVLRRGTQIDHPDVFALLVQQVKILHDAVPAGHFAIVAETKAEEGFRSLNAVGHVMLLSVVVLLVLPTWPLAPPW